MVAARASNIIGIRVAMTGVHQYIADGRSVEHANDSLATSSKKLEVLNASKIAANRNLVVSTQSVIKASQDRIRAELALVNATNAQGTVKQAGNVVKGATAEQNKALSTQSSIQQNLTGLVNERKAAESGLALSVVAAAEATNKRIQSERELATAISNTQRFAGTAELKKQEQAELALVNAKNAEKTALAAQNILIKDATSNKAKQVAQQLRLADADKEVARTAINVANAEAAFNNAQINQPIAKAQAEKDLVNAKIAQTTAVRAQSSELKNIENLEKQIGTAEARNLAIQEQQLAAAAERRKIATQLGALAGVAVIAGGAAASIAAASKFQDSLVKIDILTEASTEDTNKLGHSLLELSKTLPSSPDELGAAAYQVLSSGIGDVNTGFDITKVAAQGAAVGLGDVKDIAAVLTGVIKAYGKENITAAQAGDILFNGVKLGKGEASDFAGALGRILPIASGVGVKFDELAAATAALTNQSLTADEATTALRQILQELDNPTAKATAAFKEAHTSIESIRVSIQEKGLIPTLTDLANAFGQSLPALTEIIPNIRALTGFEAAFGIQGKETIRILNGVQTGYGGLAQGVTQASQTFSFQAKILRNELNIALIEIGTRLLPSVTQAVRNLITSFENNRAAITAFAEQGLKAIADIIKDVARGVVVAAEALKTLDGILAHIGAQSVATKAALLLIGSGLVWALPGGPIIVGLTAITLLLGQLANNGSPLQQLQTRAANIKKELEADRESTPKFGAAGPAGFNATAQLGALENKLLGTGKLSDTQRTGLENELNDLNKQIDKLKKSAVDAANPTKALDDFLAKFAEDSKNETQRLADLARQQGLLGNSAAIAAKQLLEAKQEFEKTGEAARQVEDFTAKLKLFGNVSQELAKGLGLSDIGAGNVQGVDAVKASLARADAEAFNFNRTLGTVAEAFRRSASVGQEIVLGLAQSALQASQQAASNLFSRPTQEVAGLNVQLAQQRLQSANVSLRNDPLVFSLNKQLADINHQINTQSKQQNNSSKQVQQQNQQAQDAANNAANAAQDAAQAQLDALKFANLQAGIAYERINANLQHLIDANTKQISDLQEAFLKNNEALQVKINQATGRGDRGTALSLVAQQIAAAKTFNSQKTGLDKSNQDITFQQKQLREAEDERQRQAQLAEAALEISTKQNKAVAVNTQSFVDNSASVDSTTSALDDQRQIIQDQIDSLNNQTASQDNNAKAITDQIAVYQAQTDILKAQAEAADKTLLTQQEQADAAGVLIGQIHIESGAVRDLNTILGRSLVPGMGDATREFNTLVGTLKILNDPDFRNSFIVKGFNPEDELKKIVDDALGLIPATVQKLIQPTADSIKEELSKAITNSEQIMDAETNNIFIPAIDNAATLADRFTDNVKPTIAPLNRLASASSFAAFQADRFAKTTEKIANNLVDTLNTIFKNFAITPKTNAAGGFYTSPQFTSIAEGYRPEVVLPLSNTQRSNEVLARVPPGLLAGLRFNRGQSVFAPNITVTGETLDSMESTAIRAVQRAFRDARTTSMRGGGLITQGIGPSR